MCNAISFVYEAIMCNDGRSQTSADINVADQSFLHFYTSLSVTTAFKVGLSSRLNKRERAAVFEWAREWIKRGSGTMRTKQWLFHSGHVLKHKQTWSHLYTILQDFVLMELFSGFWLANIVLFHCLLLWHALDSVLLHVHVLEMFFKQCLCGRDFFLQRKRKKYTCVHVDWTLHLPILCCSARFELRRQPVQSGSPDVPFPSNIFQFFLGGFEGRYIISSVCSGSISGPPTSWACLENDQ